MPKSSITAAADFDYHEFTSRNIGFVTSEQQEMICNARVFVCGVGGMGGACVNSLVRAGLGNLCIADFDVFELSNLNRQLFADLDALGGGKISVTTDRIRKINPTIRIESFGRDWCEHIDSILARYDIVINGMDDVRAGVLLYRKAREHDAIVIDAYTSTLPSVTVVRPSDPRPEDRLGFPTRGVEWTDITDGMAGQCLQKELLYVLVHSSSADYVVIEAVSELLSGRRSRMSFAPMVLTAGNLMCYEALNAILGVSTNTDCRGYFFNPHKNRVEKPKGFLVAQLRGMYASHYLARLARGG